MEAILEEILMQLQTLFDPQSLGTRLGDFAINLIVAAVAVVAYYLGWLILRALAGFLMRSSGTDQTNQAFIRTTIRYTILLVALFNVLNIMGVDTTGLLASLGIAGITIGFAARDAFSNLISGILIYLDRPFVIGDLVEVGDDYGRVEEITLRSTRIITPDGKMLAVPNAEIINKTVTSYTNFPHLRLDIGVTVGVEEDLARARQVLLDIVRAGSGYLEDPAPEVVVNALNDYNVALELRVWIEDERTHIEMRSALREAVFNAFNAARIDMPFETLEIRSRQLDAAAA